MMKNVDSVIVKYFGGPLDGIVEELERRRASEPLLVGDTDYVPPDGWYDGIDGDGLRYWHEGPPAWWTPRRPRIFE
jgi:hypothetical protein